MTTLIENAGSLTAGRRSFYNGAWHVAAASEAPISVGSFCAIGRNLTIMPINHDTRFAAVQGGVYRHFFDSPHPGEIGPPSRERSKGGVIIGNDVWIADNVTILGGVSIGDGACIGAGSIVTSAIPAYAVAAGVPCRVIRQRFESDVRAFLLALRWWDWPDDRIRRNQEFFIADLSKESIDSIRAKICD